MRIEEEQAFVLHARPWRETSLLVELLTAGHGRVGAVARGVQGPRQQARRAALQPWQRIGLSAEARGELWTLRRWEALDTPPRLGGEAALAGFYAHELLLRLLPRQDPVLPVFERHADLREALARGMALAWTLRRWERDLLDALGVGPDWGQAADGQALDPAGCYRIDPEQGPWRVPGRDPEGVRGSALLALAADHEPAAEDLPGLRRALRGVIEHQLGGRPLRSWSLLAEVRRVLPTGG